MIHYFQQYNIIQTTIKLYNESNNLSAKHTQPKIQ